MATPQQINEQIQLEREGIESGVLELEKNTTKLQDKEYASATIYGCSSVNAAMKDVTLNIKDTIDYKVKRGKNGVAFKDIHDYLLDIEPEVLANIALKRTFDCVFSTKKKDKKPNSVSNIVMAISHAVEAECQIRWYEEQDPMLLQNIQKKYWHESAGTEQRLNVTKLMMNRHGKTWPKWSVDVRTRLGGWLLGCVCDTTGWFKKEMTWTGKKSFALVEPTDEYLEIQSKLMDDARLFSPITYPMLIPPNDWTNVTQGGYLLNEVMLGHDLVRRGDPTLRQPEEILSFLNKLQRVGYRVNTFVLDVAKELEKRGYEVGKFHPLSKASHWPMPVKPVDIETNKDARFKYNKESAEAHNSRRAYMRSKHVRTSLNLKQAEMFRDKTFYLPWSFDYRGRTYPIPSFLTPHDTDFGKSLIRFHRESFMTPEAEHWLAFQVATTYGLDKSTMEERSEWVKEHHELISQVATDPIGSLPLWEGVDEPWQFLAACEEYYWCVIDGWRQYTGLMVAVDATCSGMQILAGLSRDRTSAKLVNVLPSDKPQDAYKAVAELSMPNIPERLREYWDRSKTKRSVMTIPYNAKPFSNRSYIRDAFKDHFEKIRKETGMLRMSLKNLFLSSRSYINTM